MYLYVGALLFGALENIRQVGVHLLPIKILRLVVMGFIPSQKDMLANYTMTDKDFKTFNIL